MTSAIFLDWFNEFNETMKAQNRRVLLLIDNASCHPSTSCNVQVAFLPKNTTGETQPMDMGVIRAVKVFARKLLLRHIANAIKTCANAEEALKGVNVFNSINIISREPYY